MTERFGLFLFYRDLSLVKAAARMGLDGIVVDWEHTGKTKRQRFADTEINCHTIDDLRRVRAATGLTVICRVHGDGSVSPEEIERAIEGGTDEILIPMVRSVTDVEKALRVAGGRCGVGVLVETVQALKISAELGQLPLTRVYVGLNDLAIERRSPNLFTPLIDGTLDDIRRHYTVPFGFGGLTLPERGVPIPCAHLMGEMARLGCRFSFLRRSFYRDIAGRDPLAEIPRLRAAMQGAFCRTADEIERNKQELINRVREFHPAQSDAAIGQPASLICP